MTKKHEENLPEQVKSIEEFIDWIERGKFSQSAFILSVEVKTETGFFTYEAWYEHKLLAMEGMAKWGGSFMQSLGETLARADPINMRKIYSLWQDDLNYYAKEMRKFNQRNVISFKTDKE